MLAKRTYKNQITIPKEVIDSFEGVEYFDVYAREGEIVLRPVDVSAKGERLKRVRQKIKALGLTERDINDAIQWVRREAPGHS